MTGLLAHSPSFSAAHPHAMGAAMLLSLVLHLGWAGWAVHSNSPQSGVPQQVPLEIVFDQAETNDEVASVSSIAQQAANEPEPEPLRPAPQPTVVDEEVRVPDELPTPEPLARWDRPKPLFDFARDQDVSGSVPETTIERTARHFQAPDSPMDEPEEPLKRTELTAQVTEQILPDAPAVEIPESLASSEDRGAPEVPEVPQLIRQRLPTFLQSVQARRWQGTVLIGFEIDVDGSIRRTWVINDGGDAEMARECRTAVSSWKFEPPRLKNGQAARLVTKQPFRFYYPGSSN